MSYTWTHGTFSGHTFRTFGQRPIMDVTVNGTYLGHVATHSRQIGRGTIDDEPAAQVETITVVDPAGAPKIGDQITVMLTDTFRALFDSQDFGLMPPTVFSGQVVSVQYTDKVPGQADTVSITASSIRAALARTYVGDEPWPDELVSARIDRVLNLAAATGLSVPREAMASGNLPSRWVKAEDVDNRSVADVLADYTGPCRMNITETREGKIGVRGLGGTVPGSGSDEAYVGSTIRPAYVVGPVQWVQAWSTVVNRVVGSGDITYADSLSTTAQMPTGVLLEDAASIARYGPQVARIDYSSLPFSTGWQIGYSFYDQVMDYARDLIRRCRQPRWSIGEVTIDMNAVGRIAFHGEKIESDRYATAADARRFIAGLSLSAVGPSDIRQFIHLVSIRGPAGELLPSGYSIEGMTESMSADQWTVKLQLVPAQDFAASTFYWASWETYSNITDKRWAAQNVTFDNMKNQ